MYEHSADRDGPAGRGRGAVRTSAEAARIVGWLAARDEAERGLREAVGRPPSQRDDTVDRMAEALRAAALGLAEPAVALAAGVPERLLRRWREQDPAFGAAMRAAEELAAGHGVAAGGEPTAAMLRVVLDGVLRGLPCTTAARVAGFSVRRFNRLRRTGPGAKLLAAALRQRAGTVGGRGYRLVRLDDPLFSPELSADDDRPT